MKKTLIRGLLFTSALAVTPAVADGFYYGAGLGLTIHGGKRLDSTTNGNDTEAPEGPGSKIKNRGIKEWNPSAVFHIGYEKRFKNFSIAIEPYFHLSRFAHLMKSCDKK